MVLPGCSILFDGESKDAIDAGPALVSEDASGREDAKQMADAADQENCKGTVADFEGLGGLIELNSYAGINFDREWSSYSAYYNGFNNPSAAAAFSADVTEEIFSFEQGRRRIEEMTFYSVNEAITLNIFTNDKSYEVDFQNGGEEQVLYFDSDTTTDVRIVSNNGWRFYIDNICHSAP